MTQFVQIRRGGLVEESSAYVRALALALAREAEELAVLGCLSGDVLEKLRIDALDCQAWMTGTDRSLFEAMGERAQHFIVAGGKVSAV